MEYLTKNFAVISAIATVASSVLAMSALFSYLSAFDSNLIWIIEYSDLIKLLLVAAAILSGTVSIASNFFIDVYDFDTKTVKQKIITGCIVSIYPVLNLASGLYFDFSYPASATKWYHFCEFISYNIAILLAYKLSAIPRRFKQITFRAAVNDIAYVIIAASSFGYTYGLKIKDVDKKTHTLSVRSTTSNLDIIKGAKIIMIMSHHTIVNVDGRTNVLPSSDIIRIVEDP